MIRICHEEIRNSEDLISLDFFSRFLTLTINYVNTNADNCSEQDLGMDYYVIGESFETSVPWDR